MTSGDFHPIFLHFPIVLFVASFFCEFSACFLKTNTRVAAAWLAVAAAVMVVPTIWTGLDASTRFYQDSELVDFHRQLAYLIGFFGVVQGALRAAELSGRLFPKPGATLALSGWLVLLVALAADEGGFISRGRTPFRTKKSHAAALGSVLAAPVSAGALPEDLMGTLREKVGVNEAVAIFQKNGCGTCHSSAFPEGKPHGLSIGASPMLPRKPDGSLDSLQESPFYQTVIVRNEMPIPSEDHAGGLTNSERLVLLTWLQNGAPLTE